MRVYLKCHGADFYESRHWYEVMPPCVVFLLTSGLFPICQHFMSSVVCLLTGSNLCWVHPALKSSIHLLAFLILLTCSCKTVQPGGHNLTFSSLFARKMCWFWFNDPQLYCFASLSSISWNPIPLQPVQYLPSTKDNINVVNIVEHLAGKNVSQEMFETKTDKTELKDMSSIGLSFFKWTKKGLQMNASQIC